MPVVYNLNHSTSPKCQGSLQKLGVSSVSCFSTCRTHKSVGLLLALPFSPAPPPPISPKHSKLLEEKYPTPKNALIYTPQNPSIDGL